MTSACRFPGESLRHSPALFDFFVLLPLYIDFTTKMLYSMWLEEHGMEVSHE